MTSHRFPSLKAKQLFAILQREPLAYRVVRRKGSHRHVWSKRYPPLTFAFHDNQTIPSGLVRKILVKDVGLTAEEAAAILGL